MDNSNVDDLLVNFINEKYNPIMSKIMFDALDIITGLEADHLQDKYIDMILRDQEVSKSDSSLMLRREFGLDLGEILSNTGIVITDIENVDTLNMIVSGIQSMDDRLIMNIISPIMHDELIDDVHRLAICLSLYTRLTVYDVLDIVSAVDSTFFNAIRKLSREQEREDEADISIPIDLTLLSKKLKIMTESYLTPNGLDLKDALITTLLEDDIPLGRPFREYVKHVKDTTGEHPISRIVSILSLLLISSDGVTNMSKTFYDHSSLLYNDKDDKTRVANIIAAFETRLRRG